MVVGYRPISGGGVTNQKMALLGLFIVARRLKVPLFLPDIVAPDQMIRRHPYFRYFFRSMVSNIRKSAILSKFREMRILTGSNSIVASFRIEKAWQDHCASNLSREVSGLEKYYVGYADIVERIVRRFPQQKDIWVVADEAGMPFNKEFIRNECSRTSIDIREHGFSRTLRNRAIPRSLHYT